MNRTDTMYRILEEASSPLPLEDFFSACQKLNPQDKGTKSYKRNMWQIKDHITKFQKAGVWYIKLANESVPADFNNENKLSTDITISSDIVESSINSSINPVGAVDYIKPNPDNFIAINPGFEYVEVKDELKLVKAHLSSAWEVPIVLEGPKGIGKTLVIQYACWQMGLPLIQFDCSENMKRYDLIGRFIIKSGDKVQYVLGVLAVAIMIANETGHCVLVFEEFNALAHNVQIALNQLTDFRRQVHIPELNSTFRLAKGKKLSIFATQNPSSYLGVNELNEAVRSRFVEYKMDYPGPQKEQNILSQATTTLSKNNIERIVRLASDTRKGVASGEFSYALSPRDLVNFAQVFERYCEIENMSKDDAWRLALNVAFVGRFDQKDERDTFIKRLESTVGSTYPSEAY